MKINGLNNYNIQQNSTFKGAVLRTPEFVRFRRQLSIEDKKLLDEYLKNIAAFTDNVVYKYWTVSSYARISKAIGLEEKEIVVNYRKELQGSTNETLNYRNPKTNEIESFPLQIILKGRKGDSLEMFRLLSINYTLARILHNISSQCIK